MRGLKLKEDMKVKCCLVASFTDAWIETKAWCYHKCRVFVASFTDAWIETELLRTETVYP